MAHHPTELQRDDLLPRYNLPADALDKAQVSWELLQTIYQRHLSIAHALDPEALYVAEKLRSVPQVHSVRTRIKDPEHLVVKVIRKKLDDPNIEITADNYGEVLTDLVGVRAIHLYKADWIEIHKFVLENWDLEGGAVANVREGDAIELFQSQSVQVKKRDYGYRSVHYLLKAGSSKKPVIAELQVRTIFEEGWSEIDHQIRYPYDQDNAVLGGFLVIMNSLAGAADAMGSYIAFLKGELDARDQAYQEATAKHNDQVKKLITLINQLQVDKKEKETLAQRVRELEKLRPTEPALLSGQDFLRTLLSTPSIGSLPSGKVGDPSSEFARLLAEQLLKNRPKKE